MSSFGGRGLDWARKIVCGGLVSTAGLILLACPVMGQETRPATEPATAQTRPAIVWPKIDRRPEPADWQKGVLKELPRHDPRQGRKNGFEIDLRHADVSGLDLHDRLSDLLLASFDNGTRWPAPEKLPKDFDPAKILETGKNPGLGVRQLHWRGITGKGVGIAIIDQPLLTQHIEYKDRLRLYEEWPPLKSGRVASMFGETQAAMHGAAVASIAVGGTVGVAPEADLYFIATNFGAGMSARDFKNPAKSIRRVLEINRELPPERKIRVISISVGWDKGESGWKEMTQAAREAREAGLLLICSSVEEVHGFKFHGLGRHPLADPDAFASYGPGSWWEDMFKKNPEWITHDRLLVPMDARTTAAPHGAGEYVFYASGGWSWSIPWIAGLYALAAQVDPSITPERFWKLALSTGETIQLKVDGKTVPFGSIANPVKLIEALQKPAAASQPA